MADYGIFGHGSSGNSAFARGIDKFHGHTKKYDPLTHYSVEGPLKGAHWLVEKGAKGLGNMGIAPGFMNRLSSEADENGNNFGLGSQRMGVGILSYLGGMYGAEALGGGGAGSGGGGGLEGGLGGLGEAGGSGGMPIGAGGYAEQGGGYVADGAGGGFNWINSDGGTGSTGLLGQGGASGGLMQQLMQQGSGGAGGGQQGQQQQQAAKPGGTMLGNPALTAALAKLVEDDAKAKRQQQGGPLQSDQQEQSGGIFGLSAEDIQKLLAMYQQQQSGGYDAGVA